MKLILTSLLTYTFLLHSNLVNGSTGNPEKDTVIIELSNKSKIVIYAEDRDELEKIENYDLNQMLKDLNDALGSKKIEKIELTDESGHKYLKDTTIIVGDGDAKTKIKIGNMEILIDADEWDDLDDVLEDLDDDDYREYSFEHKPVKRTKDNFNIDIGLNNWVEDGKFPDASDQNYALRPFGSWYIALNNTYNTWIGGPLFLDWGFGVSWYNFRFQDEDFVLTQGVDRVEVIEADPTLNSVKSRLSVPYVNVTVVPMFDFAKGSKKVTNREKGSVTFRTYKKQGVRFGVGGYVGYRLGGNSKYVYKEDGNKKKDKVSDNFYMENIRYGVRAQFGFKGLDLFAQYDINELFSNGRGPAGSTGLNAISFGITL